jgi:hypothetical protein
LAILTLTSLGAAADDNGAAPPNEGTEPFRAMIGEELVYDIGFLWFDHLAKGTLSLAKTEKPGNYRIVLEARTSGVVKWLTRHRVQRYESIAELGPGGRLRSLVHESHVIKGTGEGRKDRFKRYVFDHENRQVLYTRAYEGKFFEEESCPMDSTDPPNDILAAFYNLRAGAFGSLKAGGRYRIPTFNRKGTAVIDVEVLTDEERRGVHDFPEGGLVARAVLDEEILDTTGGGIYVWFDEEGRPARGIVENVIGAGNVRGLLRH